MVYMRHRRFLSKNHRYRKMTTKFDNTPEEGSAPPILTGTQIHDKVKDLKVVLGKGKFKPITPVKRKRRTKAKTTE